jgi:hypothetical protein
MIYSGLYWDSVLDFSASDFLFFFTFLHFAEKIYPPRKKSRRVALSDDESCLIGAPAHRLVVPKAHQPRSVRVACALRGF